MRPVVGVLHHAVPDRVVAHIPPLLRVAFTVPKPVVMFVGLPAPVAVGVRLGKLALPVGDPRIKFKIDDMRRDQAMQVIRHQHVVANQPFVCLTPDRAKVIMRFRAGKPRASIPGADGKQDRRGAADVDIDPGSRVFAACCGHLGFFARIHRFFSALWAFIWGAAGALPYHSGGRLSGSVVLPNFDRRYNYLKPLTVSTTACMHSIFELGRTP